MSTSGRNCSLPGYVERYLGRLSKLYASRNEKRLQEIVVNGISTVQEEWTYDNWNGGTYGHAVTLVLPEDIFVGTLDDQEEVRSKICQDLNKLNKFQNEHIAEVILEMEDREDPNWRTSSGVLRPRVTTVPVSSDALARIWGAGHIRVFLSHKATHRKETSQLKTNLNRYGISCFVAHDDIEPTEEWQHEIERALQSMDVLVALLTEDFHESDWTDQEVGIAYGRGVTVIAVCLGKAPYGFIGKKQGLHGCHWNDICAMSAKIYSLLHKRLLDKPRLFESALGAYSASESWEDSGWKVLNVLAAFETLTTQQVDRILYAYQKNADNRGSFKGMRMLRPLLEKWTGHKWIIRDNELKKFEVRDTFNDDEIPF